ncbi:MAG: hypothetical protein R2685_10905 [Candidatus Nitrosocosmicus sp.]|nr:hypothetical protein [Candidatus Nitrosocosmicus sp.]
MNEPYLGKFLNWLNVECQNHFKDFIRKAVRKQDLSKVKLTKKQEENWQWFVWEEQGYDHLRILGFFCPEIASAVTMIRNRVEEYKQQDNKNKSIIDEIKQQEEQKRRRRVM